MKAHRWIITLLIWIIWWVFIAKLIPNIVFWNTIVNGYNSTNNQNMYSRFDEINSILQKQYYSVSGIDTQKMIINAVKAYVDTIDDPYTVYMDAEENDWFMEDLEWESHFEWIWAVVSKKDYYVLIEQVLKWSPALEAWILPLDRIIKIEDQYVQDETLDESVSRIRWAKWSTVNITIERIDGEESKYLNFEVVRDSIDVPSLTMDVVESNWKKLWYSEISLVWEETENLLKKELSELSTKDLDWIIVDLRWNWGWLMDVAVQIASHFIPKWRLVVQTKYRYFWDETYYSKWYWDFEWKKIVVLIDWLTASAWEIIALSLQEQANATILWTQSFGKWSIQTLYEFDDGDSIKYTIWKRYPSSSMSVDKIWITPDIVVEFDTTWYINDNIDNQLEEAKNLFN